MYSVGVSLCFQTAFSFKYLFAFFRVTYTINLVLLFTMCFTECPENLRQTTTACFNNYGTQKSFVDRSEQRLFSGIDIEILRAYCSSYIEATLCIQRLKNDCPTSAENEIRMAINNYTGLQGEGELQNLCRTKSLYELYAQHMNCYAQRGKMSDLCFDRSNVAGVYSSQWAKEEICRRLQNATLCIENIIYKGCGEEAKELVHLLVRATVRGSRDCAVDAVSLITTPSSTRYVNGSTKRAAQDTARPRNFTLNLHYNIVVLLICIFISYCAFCSKHRGLS